MAGRLTFTDDKVETHEDEILGHQVVLHHVVRILLDVPWYSLTKINVVKLTALQFAQTNISITDHGSVNTACYLVSTPVFTAYKVRLLTSESSLGGQPLAINQ